MQFKNNWYTMSILKIIILGRNDSRSNLLEQLSFCMPERESVLEANASQMQTANYSLKFLTERDSTSGDNNANIADASQTPLRMAARRGGERRPGT